MIPSPMSHNVIYRNHMNAEHQSDFGLHNTRCNKPLYFFDCFNVKFVAVRSTFSGFVYHVFCVCSKKQVFWINANRIVAAMQYMKPACHSSVFNHPRIGVGALRVKQSGVKSSVSLFGKSSPNPTALTDLLFVYESPKSFFLRLIGFDKLKFLVNAFARFIHNNSMCEFSRFGIVVNSATAFLFSHKMVVMQH